MAELEWQSCVLAEPGQREPLHCSRIEDALRYPDLEPSSARHLWVVRPGYLRVLLFDKIGQCRSFLLQDLEEFFRRAFDRAAVAKKGSEP